MSRSWIASEGNTPATNDQSPRPLVGGTAFATCVNRGTSLRRLSPPEVYFPLNANRPKALKSSVLANRKSARLGIVDKVVGHACDCWRRRIRTYTLIARFLGRDSP